jgi:hypothetical protein
VNSLGGEAAIPYPWMASRRFISTEGAIRKTATSKPECTSMTTKDAVEQYIQSQLGGLDDFPAEFAADVRNARGVADEVASRSDPRGFARAMPATGNPKADLLVFNAHIAKVKRNMEIICPAVPAATLLIGGHLCEQGLFSW